LVILLEPQYKFLEKNRKSGFLKNWGPLLKQGPLKNRFLKNPGKRERKEQ